MSNFINRLFGRAPDSANVAKERLQMVLINDRANISKDTLEALKDELIQTIARYINIDANNVKINIEGTGRQQRLIADIPLRKPHQKSR